MKRKKSKTGRSAAPGPAPAELSALARMFERGEWEKMARKLIELLGRFPRHSRLWEQLIGALEEQGRQAEAVLAARQWTEAVPKSANALRTAMNLFLRDNLVGLAEDALRRLRDLGEVPGEVPELLPGGVSPEAFGTTCCLEELVLFDLGRLYLAAHKWEEAARVTEGIPFLPARNNRALALFQLDRAPEALALFGEAWREEPRNLFAAGGALRLALYLGNALEAEAALHCLRAGKPERVEDAVAQLQGLLLADHPEEVLPRYRALRSSGTWEDWGDRADLLHCAAYCLYVSGKPTEAKGLWDEALREAPEHPGSRAARKELSRPLGEREGPWAFELFHCLPLVAIDRFAAVAEGEADSDEEFAARVCAAFTSLPNAHLGRVHRLCDPSGRGFTELLLRARARREDSEAAEILCSFLTHPAGTDSDRLEIMQWLMAQGALPAAEDVPVFIKGEISQFRPVNFKITWDQEPSGLSSGDQELLEVAFEALRLRQAAQAAKQFRELSRRHPDDPMLLGNQAAAASFLGDGAEAERLLRRAIEIDPEYLMGRCNLARCLILRGAFEDAEDLLRGLDQRPEYHGDDYFTLRGTWGLLGLARGEPERARAELQHLESLVWDEHSRGKFEEVERLLVGAGRS